MWSQIWGDIILLIVKLAKSLFLVYFFLKMFMSKNILIHFNLFLVI